MKNKTIYSVWVYTDNFNLDSKLEGLASKYDGEHTGSGFGFGERDNSFEFKSEKKANRFVARAEKLKGVNRTKLYEE